MKTLKHNDVAQHATPDWHHTVKLQLSDITQQTIITLHHMTGLSIVTSHNIITNDVLHHRIKLWHHYSEMTYCTRAHKVTLNTIAKWHQRRRQHVDRGPVTSHTTTSLISCRWRHRKVDISPTRSSGLHRTHTTGPKRSVPAAVGSNRSSLAIWQNVGRIHGGQFDLSKNSKKKFQPHLSMWNSLSLCLLENRKLYFSS